MNPPPLYTAFIIAVVAVFIIGLIDVFTTLRQGKGRRTNGLSDE